MYLVFNGRRINYSVTGTGVPVVLLHGYLESSEVWNGFMQKLSAEFRVIAIDLPGHGLSDTYGATHSMEFMAAVVKEVLDSLCLNKVFLAGHSLGGYVALAFAELFPASLSGYCLFHSQPFPDPPETIEKREREIVLVKAGKKDLVYLANVKRMYAGANLELFPESVRRSVEIASRLPAEGIIAVLNGMMTRPSRLHVMEEGSLPCLWILGSMDNYIPQDIITARVRLPYGTKLVILNNSGHMGFIEEEELSVTVISDFIRNIT
jgi:pimeloyl-ACP methyl ester carboxylesterase